MRRRLTPLFEGCPGEGVEYLEEYPELAVIAAALISSNMCL